MTLILTVAQLRTLRNADESPALCKTRLDDFADVVGGEDTPFSALDMARNWGDIPEIVLCYQALMNAGMLPDTGLVWRITRMVFAATPEHLSLRHWTETLNAKNWQEAYIATVAHNVATDQNDAYVANCALDAIDAASKAAYVAVKVYDVAYLAAAAAGYGVYTDIRAMVVAELEATQ